MEQGAESNEEMWRRVLQRKWKRKNGDRGRRGWKERGDVVKQGLDKQAFLLIFQESLLAFTVANPGEVIPSQTGVSSCACISVTQIITAHTGPPAKRLFYFTLSTESGDYSSSCFKLDPLNLGSAA